MNESINQSMKDWLLIVGLPVVSWSMDKMTILIFLFVCFRLWLMPLFLLQITFLSFVPLSFTLSERDLLFSLVSCSSSLASASRLPSSSSQMLSASQLENKLFFLFLFSLMKYGVRGEDFQFLDHMIFLFKLEKKKH